jgi:hypothetical protein
MNEPTKEIPGSAVAWAIASLGATDEALMDRIAVAISTGKFLASFSPQGWGTAPPIYLLFPQDKYSSSFECKRKYTFWQCWIFVDGWSVWLHLP